MRQTLIKYAEPLKYISQVHGELEIKKFNESHNRYLILDSSEVYDLGTSLNSIGNKIFTINKEELKEVANILIEKFN